MEIEPDEITWITDQLAITNFFSAHNRALLAEHRVKAILCLDREVEGGSAAARGVEQIEVAHLRTDRKITSPFFRPSPCPLPNGEGLKDEVIFRPYLIDGANDTAAFSRAVDSLQSLLQTHQRIVVHCRAGRSRSIAVVAAYLKKARGWEAHDALDYVKAKRESSVATELVRLVERFE